MKKPKQIFLVMESKTEELAMMMKSKCETWTLTIHLRGVVQKTQLIAPPIQELTDNQELTEKHLLLKEQMNIRPLSQKKVNGTKLGMKSEENFQK